MDLLAEATMSVRRGPRAVLMAPAYDHGTYLSAESLGLRSVAASLRTVGADVQVIDECAIPMPSQVSRLMTRQTSPFRISGAA
ncbi:hypothetical protein [Micromonospora sp. LOL_023]|uniref:hypothetical protein n=1 Tax=Micromonospora sp. LOL_023 TaxID=3345418 RepID=UPI003A8501A7